MSEVAINRKQLATIVSLAVASEVVKPGSHSFYVESASHGGLEMRFQRATDGQYVTLVLDRHGVPIATSDHRGQTLDAAREHLGLGPIGRPKEKKP